MSDRDGGGRGVYLLVTLGLISFSFSPILVRFADEAPGIAIAVWRTVFAVALLTPFALPKAVQRVRELSRKERLLILASGIILGLHFIAWIESLYYTSVASASVLVTTSPIFIAVLEYFFLDESVGSWTIGAIALSIGGSALIGWGDYGAGTMPQPLLGNGIALGAAVLVSIYLIIGRVVRRKVDWLAYVYPLYVVVACTCLAAAGIRGVGLFEYPRSFYGWCFLMALGPQVIGHGSFNYALAYMAAVLLGLLTLTEPVFASVFAYVLFDELPTWISMTGMALVLVGVGLAIIGENRSAQSSKTDEEAAH